MELYKNTEFGKAIQELFKRLNMLVDDVDQYPDGHFRAYVFGGAAVHLYTNYRSSHDVDAEFTGSIPSFSDADIVVMYESEDNEQMQLSLDENFTPTLGLLHEDYVDDATPFMVSEGNPLWVYLVSPVDLAVSKLSRFSERDQEDIKTLANKGLITAGSLQERAEFALVSHIGNTSSLETSVELAVQAIKDL